jgi:anti-anti-sigma factor
MAGVAHGTNPGASVIATREGTTAIFAITGELDLASARSIKFELELELREASTERVIFDLDQLGFMDSAGIAVMLGVAEKVATVELRNASPSIRRLVDVTGLNGVLRVLP